MDPKLEEILQAADDASDADVEIGELSAEDLALISGGAYNAYLQF